MASILPPPGMPFTAEYFHKALGSVIFLHQIACFYRFEGFDSDVHE
eukprot:IDg11688t1